MNNDQANSTRRRAKARLTDMLAFEVSVVDRAANLRRWVIVKRNADMTTTEVVSKVALPSAARQAMLDGIAAVLEKLTAIASMIGEAEIDDAAQVPPELAQTVDQCSEMLRGVAEQYMPRESSSETEVETETEVEDEQKAVWSTAYVNDLPDSAFLYIAPGGEKDEGGNTVPRSLRYFPVRDAEGNIDMPHLRNALSRIPQAEIPQEARDAAHAEAERLLEEANKSAEKGCGEKDKMKKEAEEIEKAGRKIARARFEKLLAMQQVHSDLAKELESLIKELTDVVEPASDTADASVAKASGEEVKTVNLEETVSAMTAKVEELTAVVKASLNRANSLPIERPTSNAATVEGVVAPKVQPMFWPQDLSKEVKNRAAKR